MYLVDASLKCNFEYRACGPCKYCYNTLARRLVEPTEVVDLDAIEATLKREYAKCPKVIVLHGGEPLCWGKEALERLLKTSYELSGKSALQSNGSLVDDEKIELFKKYKTHVGVSIDGFWPANAWRGGTKEMTDLVIQNILRLKQAGLHPGLIITLHKGNVNKKNIKYIEEFMLAMSKEGISGKINPIIHPDFDIELTPREAKRVYLRLANFIFENNLRGWEPFTSMVNNLMGYPLSDCIFNNCDPYCTGAASIITNDGTVTFCKKFKTEILLRAPSAIYTRWEVLSQSDCQDCRYAGKVCFGGCPASSKDWDWRNKTRWCEAFRTLYEFLENKLRTLSSKIQLRTDENFKERRVTDFPGGRHADSGHNDGLHQHYEKQGGYSNPPCNLPANHNDVPVQNNHIDASHRPAS